MNIRFVDLNRKYSLRSSEIDAAIKRVLMSGNFIMGNELETFESKFSQYVGIENCIGVANGTDAIELALRAIGIEKGDLVGTVANAGFYSPTAINNIGATPIYVDVDPKTRNVTRLEVERAIDSGIKAFIMTHLYGLAVDESIEIAEYCKSKGVFLVEDCAQSHGALVGGKMTGSIGDISAFSFYPTKNLGALGDAGAVLTNSSALASRVKKLQKYGWGSKYHVEIAGGRNSRMDEIQAAILLVFLSYLDSDNLKRKEVSKRYWERITNPNISLPVFKSDQFVGHLYVVTSDKRDSIRQELSNRGIETAVHYPIPDYLQPINASDVPTSRFPHTAKLCQTVFSLPCYPELTEQEVDYIITSVNQIAF